jgi:hypothetical protein
MPERASKTGLRCLDFQDVFPAIVVMRFEESPMQPYLPNALRLIELDFAACCWSGDNAALSVRWHTAHAAGTGTGLWLSYAFLA